jgi:methylamine dehydrogenase accessory protein MauD
MSTGILVIIALQWVVILVMGVVLLGTVRQVGVLHNRLGPQGAMSIQKNAVKIGERAPEFRLRSVLGGKEVVIGGKSADGRSTLIMFISPDCPICASLLPALKSIFAQEASWLTLVFASDGEEALHRAFWQSKNINAPYVLSQELGMAFRIGQLPYGVLIDGEGVLTAQGLCNSREHIDSLFEAQRLGVASIQDFYQREAQAAAGK